MSKVAHFFVGFGGSKIHGRMAQFFIDIYSLFSFLGWTDCRVKSIKLQRQIYCPEEKELTKAEYMRLVNTAKQKGNERLNLIWIRYNKLRKLKEAKK